VPTEAAEDEDIITEDPMSPHDLEQHLRRTIPDLERKERRKFLWIIRRADLVVFHA
jgi:hypothetical protein